MCSIAYTKLFFRQARLIRLPFDIRNGRFIQIGQNLTTGFGCRVEALQIAGLKEPSLIFGNNVEINDYVHIACGESILIGDNVLIASKVFISDINHGCYSGKNQDSPQSLPNDRRLFTKPVVIEENVWLGENVCVMAGVTIGYGSVIGAGAVVTKSVPSQSIAVGNPARVIKMFSHISEQWETI